MPGRDKSRIETLDAFRFIAIMSVALFHYYSRYCQPLFPECLYPYGSAFSYFQQGHLGVNFFFMISGFVIAYTLESAPDLKTFFIKRFIRLFPPMLISAVLVFFFMWQFDEEGLFPDSHKGLNIIWSASLVSPNLLNYLLHSTGLNGNYLNGSYWSLWPEVQFYGIAGLVYFLDRRQFFRNFIFFSIILFVANQAFLFSSSHGLSANPVTDWLMKKYSFWCVSMFNYTQYQQLFLLGVVLFRIHSKGADAFSIGVLLFFMAFELYASSPLTSASVLLAFFGLFLLFVFRPQALGFLHFPWVMKAGMASYMFYLIHENPGVWMIHKFGPLLGPFSFLLPLVLIALFTGISVFSFRYIEKPLSSRLKKLLLRSNPAE